MIPTSLFAIRVNVSVTAIIVALLNQPLDLSI